MNKAIGYDLQRTKTSTMTRNQTLQVTTAYDWHDPIGLRHSALFRGRNRLRRASYSNLMVTNYGRYVALRVLRVRQARS